MVLVVRPNETRIMASPAIIFTARLLAAPQKITFQLSQRKSPDIICHQIQYVLVLKASLSYQSSPSKLNLNIFPQSHTEVMNYSFSM